MPSFPDVYVASASATPSSHVSTSCPGLSDIEVAPPTAFGGPGDLHSPEDLLTSAVAACFILSFKAIAAASKLQWQTLTVKVEGTLDNVERVVQFTGFNTSVELTLVDAADATKAERVLTKAEETCFITNSLKAENQLSVSIS